LLGLDIPLIVSYWAEWLVGFMLILLGGWTLYRLYSEVRFHQFSGKDVSNTSPLLVGIIHGSAGSATIFGLIPAIQLGRPLVTLLYIVFFAIGVLLSMSLFAVIFSHSQQQIAKYSHHFFDAFRAFVGSGAIILGLIWLL